MISQPMKGLDNKEIHETRDSALKWIANNGYKFQRYNSRYAESNIGL